MFDTNVTIVGNVLTAPEWRRTANTNSLVANFKVASTARRLDRESGRWIDGNSLRVRVNCWRKLAEGVASSIMVGDPVVVVGRLYTRDWTDAEGNPRTMYEMEAAAVGHDLARGRAKFFRNRPTLGTSAVDDAEADAKVRGEIATPVPPAQTPARYGDGMPDNGEPEFGAVPSRAPAGYDPLAVVHGGGFEAAQPAGTTIIAEEDELDPYPVADPLDEAPTGPAGELSDTEAGEFAREGAEVDAPRASARTPRRNGRRIPVPA